MQFHTEDIASLRSALVRTARARLRNPDWADDAVSETLLAALESPVRFDDPVRLRPWLFGILRHKIIDQLRTGAGEHAHLSIGDLQDLERACGETACAAADPPRQVADRQFLSALDAALRHLPAAQARAVVLRDGLGMDTPEICSELGVTAGHLWVLLHRARSRLRQGLAAHAG